jgi:hypothetical protein
LAREAARDDIHQATPWLSIEGSNVVPDWEGFEASVILPSVEHPSCGGFVFDGAHAFPSEELAPENAAASACEQCQLMKR